MKLKDLKQTYLSKMEDLEQLVQVQALLQEQEWNYIIQIMLDIFLHIIEQVMHIMIYV